MTAGPKAQVSLGFGVKVPYPEASSLSASRVGKANRRVDTRPEIRLRSELQRRGLRFRKDHTVLAGGVRVRPDVVFTSVHLAVFVDGCFWHGCPDHANQPRANPGYWGPKLASNSARDRRVGEALAQAGWLTIRIWEHEPATEGADRVAAALSSLRRPRRVSA